MTFSQDQDIRPLLADVLAAARKNGADAADIVFARSRDTSVTRRLGRPESLTQAEEAEIGLRVFVGQRQAIVSSSDLAPRSLMALAERAVDMARAVPPDPYCGLAEESQLSPAITPALLARLDLEDTTAISIEEMIERADRAEAAATSLPDITNSEGATFSAGYSETTLLASNGFYGRYAGSGFGLSVSVIAGSDAGMETDYAYDSTVFLADLKSPESIGEEAALRAARALNPRKGPTRRMPVVFDRRLAGSLAAAAARAASGYAIARGTSIFKDKLGAQVMAPGITIIDDPFLPRGPRSRPFDGEGIAPATRTLVENGVLNYWMLDLRAARQLNMAPTGHAVRGAASPPRPGAHNLVIQAGPVSREDLIADIREGFYVTEFLGDGGDIVTGDYSRGAKGFWIENGELTYPVSEMTVAGNLKEMFMQATPASDLEIRYGTNAPTIRIDGMTVAGS